MKKLISLFAILLVTFIAACGGGSSSDPNKVSVTAPVPIDITLTGTVAAGSYMDEGTITVYDATGATVASGIAINADGTYSIPTFSTSKYIPPYTIKATGSIGAAATTFYAVTSTSGTANLNPVTHAMAAILAGGDPSKLEAGQSITSTRIAEIDTSFQSGLSNLTTAVGATGSFLSSPYTANMDAALDNVTINTSPSGSTTISTLLNQASDDLSTATNANNFAAITLASNATNADIASSKSSLAANASSVLSASDLTWLADQLTACFDNSSNAGTQSEGAGRFTDATATVPIAACDPSKFTSNISKADTGFKHSGFYWMDPTFFSTANHPGRTVAGNTICNGGASAITNGYWNTALCMGYFGNLLTNPAYDKAKFLTPQILRPLNTTDGTWVVRFPIKFADGSRDYLGTHIGVEWMVVKKVATPNGNDKGWRMTGDQRKWPVYATSNVLRQTNVLNPGYQRWMSGINFSIYGSLSEIDTTHYIKSAVVTGPALPAGGLNYVNNLNIAGGAGTSPTATQANSAMCGNLFSGAYLALKLPAFTGALPPCSSIYHLTFVTSNDAYKPDCNKSSAKAGTYYCNNANANMSDSVIATAFTGSVGHAYNIVLKYGKLSDQSDDGTETYTTRLMSPPILAADLKSSALNYLNFSNASATSVANFNGSGPLSVSWDPVTSPRPVKAQLIWSQGEKVYQYRISSDVIKAGEFNFGSTACNGNLSSSCATSANWFNTAGALPADGQGGGRINIWGRMMSSLLVGSSLVQY